MGLLSQDYTANISALHRRWWAYVIFCLAFLAGVYLILRATWEPVYALRWLGLSAAAILYPITVFRRDLKHNHRPGESTLLPSLGPGNLLTLLRGVLVSACVGFLFSPWPSGWLAWMPGILYILSDLTDFLDGYLARRSGRATRLGEILEMSFDGYGVLVAGVLIVQYGQAPAWYLLVAFARYLFVAGIWILRRLSKPVYDLPPSTSRRVLASGQMCLVAALLLPVFAPPGTWFAAGLFALPFLAGFLRDWLWVSGVIRRQTALAPWMSRALTVGVPLALRLALPVLAVAALTQGPQSLDWSMPIPMVILMLEIGAILAVTFGFAARIAAVIGLLILGIHQNQASLTLAQYLMVVDYVAIVLLGSGPYSVWKPEDVLIYRRIGEKQASRKPIGSPHEAPG